MRILATQKYTVTDLGTLPGGSVSIARAINSAGWVVGEADVYGDFHAFVYSGHATEVSSASEPGMVDLGTLGGQNSFATGISDAGAVVGYAETAPGAIHAFVWRTGTALHDLGTLGGEHSAAMAIAPRGATGAPSVTGWSETSAGAIHAFVYNSGPLQDLGQLGGKSGSANGLNAWGHIAGEAEALDGVSRAILYSAGQIQDLGTLGGKESVATAINAAGLVVGIADTGRAIHGFLYSRGVMQDLGTLGGHNSFAAAVNADGHVVGTAHNAGGTPHAFLYNGAMINLNSLLPADSGWELLAATGINDAGRIVGFGIHDGVTRAFLLVPA